MALVTRCPHCQTTFRVAHDQLKLRAGLVRCGACKQIFNGVENLLRPEEPAPASFAASSPSAARLPETAKSDEGAENFSPQDSSTPPGPPTSPSPSSAQTSAPIAQPPAPTEAPSGVSEDNFAHASGISEASKDPMQRMTLMDLSGFGDENKDMAAFLERPDTAPAAGSAAADPLPPDDLDRTIDELQSKPWRGAKKRRRKSRDKKVDKTTDAAEPGFVTHARRQQRIGRALRIAMGAGSAVLLIGALVQGAYIFRDQLAARFPQVMPYLAQGCAVLGCRIGLPAQIDMVSIESSELQAVSPEQSLFSLVALLRNRAAIVQAWPHLELTLNDADGKPLARRVFAPRDYVPTAQDQVKGFAPNSEQPVKLNFTLSQLQASGYRVYLFYP